MTVAIPPNSDGTPNFDFYRRSAARQRRQSQRALVSAALKSVLTVAAKPIAALFAWRRRKTAGVRAHNAPPNAPH